jgi:ATP-dependent DNA helicase RecG
VEVGVDVRDATIIVIEHAERFGLAQLHQLRGRVGRGDKPSTCILLYTDRSGEIAKSRLRIMRETNDGFRIAEEDLRLRGSGDILGVRQSGLPVFRFADLSLHSDLLRGAHEDAKLILHRDARLATPRGHALLYLLHLFGYEENIRYLEAG